nr:hypothetical protein [uncultured Acetobacteroides sp.]
MLASADVWGKNRFLVLASADASTKNRLGGVASADARFFGWGVGDF